MENPMTEHLVLIFAYHFPPENVIGAARPFRFWKYLSRLGYTCHVITAADQTGRDTSSVECVPDPFVTCARRGLRWQLERAIRKVFLPGEVGTLWSRRAFKVARAYIRARPGARVTILSTFPPLGPHFAAWQLARAEGLSWIADFRDPLAEGGMGKEASVIRKQMYRWLERILTAKADAVIVNTDVALINCRKRLAAFSNRVHLIWNGFDPEEGIQPLPIPLRDFKVLSHVGELYQGRNATLILESLARLMGTGRIRKGSIRVRLIGPAQASSIPDPEFVYQAKAQGWLDLITDEIPQIEARKVAQTSSYLLLLQPQSAVQVPGKLFEYIQIGRPILAYIQPNSPTERLLERSGIPYRCVYPGSTSEAIDDVVADFFNLPSTALAPSRWFEEKFNAMHQVQTLDALIRSLHDGRTFASDSNCLLLDSEAARSV